MLKIGMLCHSSLGGSSRVAIELARSLAQRGHPVQIFSRTPPVLPLSDHPNLSSVSLYGQKPEDRDPGALQAHWSSKEQEDFAQLICQRLRQVPIDILHFHYALPFVHVAKRIRALLGESSPSIVGTLHGTDVTLFSEKASAAAELSNALNETADALTTVSLAHGRLAQEIFPGLKLPITIPNFIDSRRFRPRPRSSSGPPVLIHASNFRAVKQPLRMAQIFLGVRAKLDVKLQLLGTGPELQKTVDFLAQSGFGHCVEVLGFQLDISEAFSQGDVLLVSSVYESFCMTALEAMACGTPVIAPRVGGLPEVIIDGQTGFLYSPDSIEDAVAKTVALLSDPSSIEKTRRCASQRALDFDSVPIVSQYVQIYQDLAKRQPRARSPFVLESGQ